MNHSYEIDRLITPSYLQPVCCNSSDICHNSSIEVLIDTLLISSNRYPRAPFITSAAPTSSLDLDIDPNGVAPLFFFSSTMLDYPFTGCCWVPRNSCREHIDSVDMPVSPGTRHVTLRPLVSRSSPSSLARRVHHDLPLKTNRNLLGSRLQFT